MKALILGIFLSMAWLCLYGQSSRIVGCVYDEATQEPIPFATVGVLGTSVGVVTDMEGCFNLIYLGNQSDSIAVNSMGYVEKRFSLEHCEKGPIKVYLGRTDVLMEEIIVVGGANPAHSMMDSIWRYKSSNSDNKVTSESFEKYDKMEIDLVNFNRGLLEKNPLFKKFSFLLNGVDSTSEEKPFLPTFIMESVAQYYRANKQEKVTVLAEKTSGVNNGNLTPFLTALDQKIDFYNDFIQVVGKSFISPISVKGHRYYKYYLLDSARIDDDWSYKLKIVPKRTSDYVFMGDMWVTKKEWALKQISIQVPKEINLNFVQNLSLYQTFERVENKLFLKKDKLALEFLPAKAAMPGMIGRKSSSYRKHIINDSSIGEMIENWEIKDPIALKDNQIKSEKEWNALRHEKLSSNELKIYAMVDSLENMPLFKTYVDLIETFFTGYYDIGPIEFGPYYNLLSTDQVEGWRFAFGFRTNKKFSKRIRLNASIAYGTLDERFKYGGGLQWVLSRKRWSELRFKYLHDLDLENGDISELDSDNLVAGLIRKPIRQRLVFIDRLKGEWMKQWNKKWSTTLSIENLKSAPYFDFEYRGENGLMNTFNTSEVSFNWRYTSKEKLVKRRFSQVRLLSKKPIYYFGLALGLPSINGSQFNYQRIHLKVVDQIPMKRLGYARIQLKAGYTNGDVPYLLKYVPKGNDTYYYNPTAFNNMNPYEFASDGFVKADYTHYFNGALLNRLPGFKRLKWRSLWNVKGLYGFVNGTNSFDNGAYLKLLNNDFYAETSFGIENVFKLLRFDVVRRLTHTADNKGVYPFPIWAFYGSIQFKF